MLDRQKVEAILAKRFPSAAAADLAAAANAIMASADNRSGDRLRTSGHLRPFRALVDTLTTVSVSSRIDAPTRRVFDMFTDVEHAAEHVSGISRIEMLTPGPFRLGTRWRESRQLLGRVDDADLEVTAFERYRT